MGIFNLFKKEKPIREVRKVSLNEINEVILKKKQEIKADETDVVNLIKSRVNSLIIEFESEILAINQINLSEKKVEEKTKLIVGENLDRFLVHLKKLKNNLEDMGNGGIQDLIKNLDLNIHEFKNKSYMNFEKATFLIGKELGDVMKSIKTFYMDLNETGTGLTNHNLNKLCHISLQKRAVSILSSLFCLTCHPNIFLSQLQPDSELLLLKYSSRYFMVSSTN